MPERSVNQAERVDVDAPVAGRVEGSAWQRGDWPARWISCPGSPAGPHVALYRLVFQIKKPCRIRIHVTADERYDLYLDGQRVGRGSQRGSLWRWYYESYDLRLARGRHVLVARVWSLGDAAPVAQVSIRPGFLLLSEGHEIDLLSTGCAGWEARLVHGLEFRGGPLTWGSGHDEIHSLLGGQNGWEQGRGTSWHPAIPGSPGASFHQNSDRISQVHRLSPATLPPMYSRRIRGGRVRHLDAAERDRTRAAAVRKDACIHNEVALWQAWWDGGRIQIPPRTTRRAIIDLGTYYCVYPKLHIRGGQHAIIRFHWAESLYEAKPDPAMADDHLWSRPKGHRSDVEGKYFVGHGPEWHVDDGRGHRADTLWWHAGRFVEVHIQTHDASVWLDSPELEETRYPMEMESRFTSDDKTLDAVIPILIRGLQMCAHETYMDCPYWEQLMYAGDTRLQALCGYTISRDDRLPRQALRLFNDSRLPSGLTQSRFPTSSGQVIPPFALHWIGMVHDYAQWRGDAELVRELLPGVRAVLEAHVAATRPDGLVEALPGWNFVDWVPGWRSGEPPMAQDQVSCVLMSHLVLALREAARLEDFAGLPSCANRWRGAAKSMATAIRRTFWDARRACLADDSNHQSFSEHAQAMALLAGLMDRSTARRLHATLASGNLPAKATIYFAHYVLDALAQAGHSASFYQRLSVWKILPEQGFCTPYEAPGNTRSDCHAWSSHPVYHLLASICGIRPAEFGFGSVSIRPMLGDLTRVQAEMVHPRGCVGFSARRGKSGVRLEIRLPADTQGVLWWNGSKRPLRHKREVFTF